ncbi:MAG: hypothetical protein ACJATI_004803 [Halioglobus sp.]|jgi:hypothetical protein
MTYAYNSESYDNGKERYETIQPLPTLKVNRIGSEYGTCYITPEVVLASMPAAPAVGMQFSLNELEDDVIAMEESYLAASMMVDPVDPDFLSHMRFLGQGNYSAKAKKVKEYVDKALATAKVIDQLTGGDLVSMPLVKTETIGQSEVSIIFNKARIYPTFTLLEVFIRIELAQEDIDGNPVELFFSANDILFSQEDGIIGGTISLVNDYAIKVGSSEKAAVWLKGMTKTAKAAGAVLPNGDVVPSNLDPEDPFDDKYYDKGGTYVSFNCDGFQELGIAGEVLFSREWIIPADEFGTPTVETNENPTPRVRGVFGTVIQNMNDLYIDLDIDHFLVSKYQDISLEIDSAYLDMSSHRNPPGIPANYGVTPNLWEGVYIKKIGITMPEPFRRTCSPFSTPPIDPNVKPETCRIKIQARHLLIDEYGVDGAFSVSGQAPLIGGPIMDGEWGWSLNSLGIQIQNSELTGFTFAGGLGVPILDEDDPLTYSGEFDIENNEYDFTVETSENTKKSFPVFNAASVNLTGPITVDITVQNGEFDASVTLSAGNLTIGDPKDKKEGEGGSILKMPSIDFTDLVFSTKSPKIQIGYFGLSSGNDQASVVNFPVVPTNLGLETPANSNQVNLTFGVMLNLMKTDESTISATGGFILEGEITRDISGSRRWVYKDLIFTGAEVTVNVPQFYGKGSLSVFKKDPDYGSGFSASLTAKIIGKDLDTPTGKGKFELKMAAIFGSSPSSSGELGEAEPTGAEELDNYRYWMVDGLVQSESLAVPLIPPFEINGFGGGAFYHMRPHSFNQSSTTENAVTQIGESTTGLVYRPNAETGLGLKFTTSITTKGDLMSGLLTAIIRFSPSGSLQNITFWGTVDILKEGGPFNRAKPDILSRVDKNIQELEDVIEQDVNDVLNLVGIDYSSGDESGPEDGAPPAKTGIQGQLGISLDFDDGFTFHGFAKVNIKSGNVLTGEGTMDILLDLSDNSSSSENGDWHVYIGGYYDNAYGQQVLVPGFFNESEEVVLEPVSVTVGYNNVQVVAEAYFLTGTTIPGPPPPPADVIAFFGSDDPDVVSNNRDKMSCGGKGPAMGTGIAFGATAKFELNAKVGGVFGGCPLGFEVKALARVGFDLALLKYDQNTVCALSGDSPHGLNGFRATGRAYALVVLQDGHITCFDLPDIGIGVKVEFDILKPSFLDVRITAIAFGERATLGLDIGTQCGTLCE